MDKEEKVYETRLINQLFANEISLISLTYHTESMQV